MATAKKSEHVLTGMIKTSLSDPLRGEVGGFYRTTSDNSLKAVKSGDHESISSIEYGLETIITSTSPPYYSMTQPITLHSDSNKVQSYSQFLNKFFPEPL